MKRLIWLVIVLLGVSAAAYFLIKQNEAKKKGIVTADRGFTVEKIEDIKKIVIKHKKLQPMIFTREGKSWKMDGKFDVDPGVFVNIEKVLLNMRLQYIPPAASTKNILESISKNGIQVDLYDGDDEPFKIFHIGSDTQKGEGTYMVMGGSTQPYVMHLPGMSGGLRSRFEQPAKNYRDKFLYKFPADKLASIKVEYPMDNFSSFIIQAKGENFEIAPLLDLVKKPINPVNQKILEDYVDQFEMMGTEGLLSNIPEKDSILNESPVCTFTFTQKDGSVTIHEIYPYDDIVEQTGKITRTKQELNKQNRVFIHNNEGDLYTAQSRVVGGMFKGYEDFFAAPRMQKMY